MNPLPKTISAFIISGLLSITAITAPAFANSSHHESSKIERIAEKLALSEEQTTSFTQIMVEQRAKRQALKDQDLTRDTMREEMKSLRDETLASLETILSEEQLSKMHEMMEHRKKHRHGMKQEDDSER